MVSPYSHEVTLQRLDNYLQYDIGQVYLSHESFENSTAWNAAPVIFAEAANGQIHHPDFSAVDSGILPSGFRFAGTVSNAAVAEEGTPRLNAVLNITDAEAELLSREGKLGISTGFSGQIIPDKSDKYRIIGDVVPNHVLVFEQGACPSCFPRDAGAVFLNTVGCTTMTDTDETKSMFKTILDKLDSFLFSNSANGTNFDNTEKVVTDAEPEAEPVEQEHNMTEAEVKTEEVVVDARDNEIAELKNTIALMKAAEKQRVRDEAWAQMKNTLPSGFLVNEAETRAEFENNKDAFYGKLMAHKAEFANVKAEGSTVCPCKHDLEQQMKNTIAENAKKLGFSKME